MQSPFKSPVNSSTDRPEPHDAESTPTQAPMRPSPATVPQNVNITMSAPPRRSAANTASLAGSSVGQDESTDSDSSVETSDCVGGEQDFEWPESNDGSGTRAPEGATHALSPKGLGQLRDELTAKMLAQNRVRRSYGSSSGAKQETRRVSPIKEEEGGSAPASITSVLVSPVEPLRSLSSVSTESTGSNRTIKGSAPPTPAAASLRTPSYPFPYVPRWSYSSTSGPQHQPFTALSPTGLAQGRGDQQTPDRATDADSAGSTPAANTAFIPAGIDLTGCEDPRYPTPNLYDLVLHLNSEPGLEQWWTVVTNLLHAHFEAERATLIQPLDPTDFENMPWGQKATFSMNGREEFVPLKVVQEQTDNAVHASLGRPDFSAREYSAEVLGHRLQKLHPERLRPRLESRHSYAGHGRESKDLFGTLKEPSPQTHGRPLGPQRTVTHAPGMIPNVNPDRILPKRNHSTNSSLRHDSLSDPDFSSIAGGVDAGPYAEVFSTLRALNHEARPLIETRGVNRVLDRGRVVAVTRDYAANSVRPETSKSATSSTNPVQPGQQSSTYKNVLASNNASEQQPDYEEYEQHPTSPWAQSPAPSPAVQSDEEDNPFFATNDRQVNDSFEPAVSPKDYSQFGYVEAIGVDHASTVMHIPLIHPTLSQPMQSLRMTPQSRSGPRKIERSNTADLARKAPIAVLSILTPTVPYPRNLTQSLRLLGPHLATSFATAQQFSAAHVQSLGIRHRQTASAHHSGTALMTVEPTSLDNIVSADLERPLDSFVGSVTSPSDFSSRSRASPSSSIVETPGWDPAAHGWTASRSAAGTPAVTGSEMVDNYFEANRRSSQWSTSNADAPATATKSSKKPSSSDSKAGSSDDNPKTPFSERKSRASSSGKGDKLTALKQPAEVLSNSKTGRPSIPLFPDIQDSRKHSLLHSYGADFNSSLGLSPFATPNEQRAPNDSSHSRKGSYPEDMPPPSERLLRTIIDSVPVQIFTAQPDTGQLTWVNSKFLIYRGQEARQVLSEPWAAMHPDDRSEFLPAWHRSLRTNQQLQQKVRLQRFDGSHRWFYVRAAPLKDKRQKVVHWIGTMMDFHDQQTAESNSARQAETAASEAKYRALANSSPQIVFAVNRSKGVTFCNSQWLHYSGQTETQALGVGFMDHVHPDDLAKCKLPTFEEGSNQPTNVPTSVPAEPKRTWSQSATSSDSSSTEMGISNSDEAVSPFQNKPPQRKLSELATTGILKVSRDADGRPSYSTEVRLKSKDGKYRWHLVRVLLADPVLNHFEEETWYGTCTDINDHKTLERDLKETMDEKSRFLSNMSHEIRTPLNGITGMVNFLIDSSLSAEQMEHVNIIRASTEGLRGLINDILDLSKAEAGMIQLNLDWLYARALIEEVNDLTSAMAIDKGLELNYVVEENVPAQIKGDRFRIRQILLNVIGNAIKFTQKGEVFVRCSLQEAGDEVARNEAYIQFEVIDTGRGFTDKDAEYLFKRFSQIDGSSTRQHGGTGLGLVISRQLAQLHGGDMSAKGVPDKGSTFTFYIKTSIPSEYDRPPVSTPGGQNPSGVPLTIGIGSLSMRSSVGNALSAGALAASQSKLSPKFLQETTQSPPSFGVLSDIGTVSPSVSSASSDPSVRSAARTSSLRSERSSASSIAPDIMVSGPPMKLSMPSKTSSRSSSSATESANSLASPSVANILPPMFSILVVAPLKYTRLATVHHIDKTLPKNVPHQITARESFEESQKMLGSDDPVIFTHVVVVLQDVDEIIALMEQVLKSTARTTALVLITDLAQKRKIMRQAPNFHYSELVADRRLRFVFKPLKPSRFGLIFDPQKEREMSLDRNQDSAQQVAVNQKQVFEELTRRLGNKDKRVLLVEDNKINQMVILKFLAKVSIKVETVQDGVQCTDKVFSNPHSQYSIILCDLHMPNKDGYQTCKEIRKWEKKNRYAHLPIIALSANVLGDVYQKCVDAGFNSYMTKPVDFKELSAVMLSFMDCDPDKTHEFMKVKRGHLSSFGR